MSPPWFDITEINVERVTQSGWQRAGIPESCCTLYLDGKVQWGNPGDRFPGTMLVRFPSPVVTVLGWRRSVVGGTGALLWLQSCLWSPAGAAVSPQEQCTLRGTAWAQRRGSEIDVFGCYIHWLYMKISTRQCFGVLKQGMGNSPALLFLATSESAAAFTCSATSGLSLLCHNWISASVRPSSRSLANSCSPSCRAWNWDRVLTPAACCPNGR